MLDKMNKATEFFEPYLFEGFTSLLGKAFLSGKNFFRYEATPLARHLSDASPEWQREAHGTGPTLLDSSGD